MGSGLSESESTKMGLGHVCGFNNFWLRAITWRQRFSEYLAAAAASPGNLLEMQIPGTRPNHPGSETGGEAQAVLCGLTSPPGGSDAHSVWETLL